MTPQQVAMAIRDEIGSRGVSQLGDGLADAIHDVYSPYATWAPARREAFREAVYQELYS